MAYCRQSEEASGDELRREVFACRPPEHSGGSTTEDLLVPGRRVGPDDPAHVMGVGDGRYEAWLVEVDEVCQQRHPQATPAALLDGRPVDTSASYDARAPGDVLHG